MTSNSIATTLQRNSDGTSVKVGSSFEITRTLTGEFAVGYLKRTYQDPTLPDIKGTIADGSLIWQASALTTAKLLATSTVSEFVLPGVSGDFSRDFSLEVDHAFRRWLIGTLKVGYGHDIYVGSDRADNRYFASAGIAYKLTRDMQLRAELRRDWLHSYDLDASIIPRRQSSSACACSAELGPRQLQRRRTAIAVGKQLVELGAKAGRDVRARQRVGHIGGEKADLRAAVEAAAVELQAVERLRARELDHRVGELDFAAGAALLFRQRWREFPAAGCSGR